MDLGLKDRVAIVTGGGGPNQGGEFCRTLAQEGANVVVADLKEELAQKVAKECEALGVKALPLKLDVTSLEAAEAMAKKAMDTFGRIDILVNSAFYDVRERFLQMSPDKWRPQVDVCFFGVMNCTRAVLPHMIERKWGRVVSIASDAGRAGAQIEPIYAGAKGAIIAFSKSLALDHGRDQVTFNCVSPGITTWDQTGQAERMGAERFQDMLRRFYPLRKLGTPRDTAGMVVFLASDRAGHITGQTFSVNGGFCMP